MCNIGNLETGMYLSTFVAGGEREEDDSDVEEELTEEQKEAKLLEE